MTVAGSLDRTKLMGAGGDEGDAEMQDTKVVLAECKFLCASPKSSASEKQELKAQMERVLFENNMVDIYEHLCSHLGWTLDSQAVQKMRTANERTLEELDAKIKDCEENMGDEEVRDALLARADHHLNIGARQAAWDAYDEVAKKAPSANQKLTIAFSKMRLEILLGNWKSMKDLVAEAKTVCEKGGDWEKKNRLMVYEAITCLVHRNFDRAAKLFLDAVATFTTYELFDYQRCIFYAVVTAVIVLPRPELKKKLERDVQVVEAPEVLTVIHKLPGPQKLLNSLYYCNYKDYLPGFLEVVELAERDLFLHSHVKFYMREARIIAYAQFLASYKNVTMAAMASAFGIGVDFLDAEISNLIVAGRLTAKIDRVNSVIETVVLDERHANYQKLIKQGDLLLNRIQKLSKIVDIE